MTSPTTPTVLLDGVSVRLTPLRSGGQAEVCRIVDPSPAHRGLVVKLYRDPPDEQRRRKLARMVEMDPLNRMRATKIGAPPELAWPLALARDPDGQVVGYSMRAVAEPDHLPLFTLFSGRQRQVLFSHDVNWAFLLGVSWNLAFVTDLLHHEGLLVGDFSCNNVVVDQQGFVTFLDCDSMAFTVRSSGESYPSEMYTADYAPPERQAGGPASRVSDDFALAVLVYQLLTAGSHPFAGIVQDADPEQTATHDNIVALCSHVVHPDRVRVPRGMARPEVLPPSLLALARRAFGPGAGDATQRPTAGDWLLALKDERERIQRCDARPRHRYGAHLDGCPWCALAAQGRDPFPGPAPKPTPAPDPQPAPAAAAPTSPQPTQPAAAKPQPKPQPRPQHAPPRTVPVTVNTTVSTPSAGSKGASQGRFFLAVTLTGLLVLLTVLAVVLLTG